MKNKLKEILNISGNSTPEEESQQIDLSIKINEIRSRLPHQRARAFARHSLEILYETKGIKADFISSEDLLSSETDEDEIIGQCWIYLMENDLQNGLNTAQSATEAYPSNPETWYVSAIIKDSFGEHEDAVYELKRAIKLKPSESVYHFELGAMYERHGGTQ